mgnify:CR=1 FL=1
MAKKRLQYRLGRVGNRILHAWKWFLGLAITTILTTALDKHFGSPVWGLIEDHGMNTLKLILYSIVHYPIETSVVILVLTIAAVVALAYWETRDPKGLSVGRAVFKESEKLDGARIINKTGFNLLNCTLHLESVDRKSFQQRVEFGYYLESNILEELPEGEGINFRLYTTLVNKIKKLLGDELYNKDIETLFVFRYKGRGEEINSFWIYITFRMVRKINDKNETYHVPHIVKIET